MMVGLGSVMMTPLLWVIGILIYESTPKELTPLIEHVEFFGHWGFWLVGLSLNVSEILSYIGLIRWC